MLVLKRKLGQSITIGNDITVTLKRYSGTVAHIMIDAPKNVIVMRTELVKAEKGKEKDTGETGEKSL